MQGRKIIAAASLTLLSLAAHAAPFVIDFTGMADGALVNDYYNGGTDSFGNTGTNYGIHFSNARVIYNKDGALITPAGYGGFSISFAPGITANLPFPTISFLGAGYGSGSDGTTAKVWNVGNTFSPYDTAWINGNGNPYCSTKAACDEKGLSWIDPMDMGGSIMGLSADSYRVDFPLAYADDIGFGLSARPARRRYVADDPVAGGANGEVPEPGAVGLLLVGLLALGHTKRQRTNF